LDRSGPQPQSAGDDGPLAFAAPAGAAAGVGQDGAFSSDHHSQDRRIMQCTVCVVHSPVVSVVCPPDDIFDVDVGGTNLKSMDRSAYVTYTVRC
jgi:hypothetical protein